MLPSPTPRSGLLLALVTACAATALAGQSPGVGVIGDRVWIDVDGDGRQSSGEPGAAGVTVELTDARTPVSPIAFAVTDSAGGFSFADYPAGEYRLRFDHGTGPDAGNAAFVNPGVGDDPRPDEVTVLLRIGLGNLGVVDLVGLELDLPLAELFGGAYRGIAGAVTISGEAATGLFATLAPDGDAEVLQLRSEPGARLPPGDSVAVEAAVVFDAAAAAYPLALQASARATTAPPDSLPDARPVVIADLSDGGTDLAGTNPDAPGDTGASDDPLALRCSRAAVRLSAGLPRDACAGSAQGYGCLTPSATPRRSRGGRAATGDPCSPARSTRDCPPPGRTSASTLPSPGPRRRATSAPRTRSSSRGPPSRRGSPRTATALTICSACRASRASTAVGSRC